MCPLSIAFGALVVPVGSPEIYACISQQLEAGVMTEVNHAFGKEGISGKNDIPCRLHEPLMNGTENPS
jgi:hypothetical protein